MQGTRDAKEGATEVMEGTREAGEGTTVKRS